MNKNDYLEVDTLKSHCSSSINKLNEDINKLLETKEYLITLKERDLKGQYYTVWVAKIEDLCNLISVLVISITKDINDYETLSQILSSVPSIQTYDGERIYNNYIEAEKKRNEHNSNASNNMTKANKSIEPFKSLFLKWSGEESAKASQWQYVMDSEQQKMNEYDEIVQKTSGLFMNSQFPRQIAINSINNILDAGEYLNGLNMSLKWRLDMKEYIYSEENGEECQDRLGSEIVKEELKKLTNPDGSLKYSEEEIDEIITYLQENNVEELDKLMEYNNNGDVKSFDELLNKLINPYGDLKNKGVMSYYYSDCLKETTLGDGRKVFWEIQHGGKGNKKYPWDFYVPYEDTVDDKGCFYYALCASISVALQEPYPLERLMKDIGGKVQYVPDNSVEYGYRFSVENSPISNLNGGKPYLDLIDEKNDEISISAKEWSKYDKDGIYNKLLGGDTFIVYDETRIHWVTLAGIDGEGKVVVVCANNGVNRVYSTSIENIKELNSASMVFDLEISKR